MKTVLIESSSIKDLLIIEWQSDYEIVGSVIFGNSDQKGVLINLFNLDGYSVLGLVDEIKEDEMIGNIKVKSLLPLIESKIHWENPLGKIEPKENSQYSTFGGEKTVTERNPMNTLWHEAEKRTFDRSKTVLFIKNK